MHPDRVGVFIFDCSSAHEAYADDALMAHKMNRGPGGQQPKMHNTVINQHIYSHTYLYAHSSHAFYFLPHDYSYDLIFPISLSMLIATISYLYSNGILSDLHHPLRQHTPYCSYSFHDHSDLTQVFLSYAHLISRLPLAD